MTNSPQVLGIMINVNDANWEDLFNLVKIKLLF